MAAIVQRRNVDARHKWTLIWACSLIGIALELTGLALPISIAGRSEKMVLRKMHFSRTCLRWALPPACRGKQYFDVTQILGHVAFPLCLSRKRLSHGLGVQM